MADDWILVDEAGVHLARIFRLGDDDDGPWRWRVYRDRVCGERRGSQGYLRETATWVIRSFATFLRNERSFIRRR